MPHAPNLNDLKREAIYKAQQAKHTLEKTKREGVRGVKDLLNPPSTMTEVERFFEDTWKDDIKPAAAKWGI